MKNNISIIGCGWLGLPLAAHLVEKGYKIKGSTTSKEKLNVLKDHKIKPYHLTLNEAGFLGDYKDFLAGSATVIINIPPGLRKNSNKNHIQEVEHLIKAIAQSNVKKVLYVSSTSVFKDDETFPKISNTTLPNAISNSAKQIIAIEEQLQQHDDFDCTIIRFGGLFDEDRHPVQHLSGKTNLANAEAPINLIGRQDCIAIIASIIKNNFWNTTLNAVYPVHTNKKTYYSNFCLKTDLPLPYFDESKKSKGKVVQSLKLVQLLNYTFKQAP